MTSRVLSRNKKLCLVAKAASGAFFIIPLLVMMNSLSIIYIFWALTDPNAASIIAAAMGALFAFPITFCFLSEAVPAVVWLLREIRS